MRNFINKYRAKFGLLPVKDVWSHWMGENVIIACDRELNPVTEGVSFNFTQTGFMLLPSNNELPNACHFKKITAEAISTVITECVTNDKYKKNALLISQKLQHINGVEMTVQLIEQEFGK